MRRFATIAGVVLPVVLFAGFALAELGFSPGLSTREASGDDIGTTTTNEAIATTEPATSTTEASTTTTMRATETTETTASAQSTSTSEPDDNSEPEEGEGDVLMPTEELFDGDRREFQLTDGTFTFIVDEAGTVTLTIGSLQFVQAIPNAGWDFRVKHADQERVEVRFRQGDAHFDFKARIHHDVLEVRVQRNGADLPAAPPPPPAPLTNQVFAAAGAGSVTIGVSSEKLQLVTVSPNEDWVFDIEDARNDRVRVEFTKGEDRVRFELRLGSAQPEVRSG